MTSSESKINVISLVENCLSYNISKSGRKSITGKRDNLNSTKTKITSSKKYIFLSLDANMMTLFHFLRVRVVWNRISNSCSFHPCKKKRILWMILRAILFWKMACFWANLHYIAHSSTRGFWTLTHAHGLMKGQEWLQMNGICQLWYKEFKSCGNFEFWHFRALYARTTRARTRTDGKFWNALNDLVRTQNCL